ncbi:BatA domain-containing protein [Mucilaginibacter phyllosphaerae]|uniref:Aerotolerance regulator N-terminal domain-containing protein n=1 Tax=Mucilaginibacter phyllosphaerae TaxID=1812349 RepID=A0A4Y8AFI2_9SPHI|nr:BatA domain-containing protein [Mucilaginibacter phyllosphaerae]MBB3968861.1 hypothetical protein [Mucilaginibacter phyllosphaerae]TEW67510.1 hypothetical protein E2R65_05845 [Mucilaginibacter phyllosphaerae]GGH13465.1 hypothetical protein GCM10007352_20910 [Mucilaginibacter phyllosphaerae]
MQFLTPIWFLALAALGIPVIIHLWNIRPGKTLKVGSISLITEASKSSSRSFKLLDVLLLILRCLLLILLAALLASPIWQRAVSMQKSKGWLLIPKENFKETYQKFKLTVDSLSKAGYEFHYFDSGFAQQDLNRLIADTDLKDTVAVSNYWTLIKALNSKVTAATPVHIFTQNGINYFKGTKPAVDMKLYWQTYTAADSVSTWLASASLTVSGAIKVTQGNSNPAGVTYKHQILHNEGNPQIRINMQKGQLSVSLKDGKRITVDTGTMRLAIYTDKYALDAGYLKAALSAAVNFSGRKAIIKQYNNPSSIPGGQNWLFWLSEQVIIGPAKNSKNIFKYEAGKAVDVNTWIEPGHIALAKTINADSKDDAIWKDGFGKTVLELDNNTYHFYSRFNPLWNDLVWSDAFPKMILKLIAEDQTDLSPKQDKRVLSNEEIQPQVRKQNKPATAAKATQQTDLSRYFWLMLVVILIIERVLSHQTKQANNG